MEKKMEKKTRKQRQLDGIEIARLAAGWQADKLAVRLAGWVRQCDMYNGSKDINGDFVLRFDQRDDKFNCFDLGVTLPQITNNFVVAFVSPCQVFRSS